MKIDDVNVLINRYLKGLRRKLGPDYNLPEVIYNKGWFSIRSYGESYENTHKQRLSEFTAMVNRVEQSEPYTERPPINPVNPKSSLPKLNEPSFHKRKGLRKLRNDIKQLCPYMTETEVVEWIKSYSISTLDLVYLILGMDTKS
jgi:hypothetical protein